MPKPFKLAAGDITIYLLPRMCLNLRELELGVIGIHLANLLPRWGAQHFNNLHQLVDARIAWENWLTQQQLSQHTTGTPNIYRDETTNQKVASVNRSLHASENQDIPMLVV